MSRIIFSASTVCLLLMIGCASAFWMKELKHCMSAISIMFESSSLDIPSPTGWPSAFSFGAALRTSSQVDGLIPT